LSGLGQGRNFQDETFVTALDRDVLLVGSLRPGARQPEKT
jgi:hypothetical protein